jgi:hypothetical protein
MSKFISLLITLMLLITANSALAKNKKPKPSNKIDPLPTKTAPSNVSKLDSIPSDIRQLIETSKKYRGTQSIEKSQLETQAQYEARLSASQPTDLKMIELTLPVTKEFKYYADNQSLIVGLDRPDYSPISDYNEEGIRALRSAEVEISKEEHDVTCTNGYGASFSYLYTAYSSDYYGIAYYNKKEFSNKNDPSWADAISSSYGGYARFKDEYSDYDYGELKFKIPMSVNDVRNYITSDEKNLNGKLKFVITLRPVFPFYKENSYFIGDKCGSKDNNRGGTSLTSNGYARYSLFDIARLKLVDSSNGKILIERDYPQRK